MDRLLIIVLILSGLVACNNSNRPERLITGDDGITIDSADYDFGMLADTVHIVHHRFVLKNHLSDTCHITRIERSCGCTKVKASSTIVPPSASVFLDIEVDLGSNYSFFERDVNIYTDQQAEPLTIFLRACRQMPEYMVRQNFPFEISPQLRASVPYLIMGYIAHGQVKTHFLNICNTSDKTVTYKAKLEGDPPFVSVFHDEQLPPNGIGRITFTTDLSLVNNIWGLQRYKLLISSDGHNAEIPVEAIYIDDIPKSDLQPRIMTPVHAYNVDPAKKTETPFVLYNVGKAPLHIRDIKSYIPVKGLSIGSKTIAPDSNDTLVVTIDSKQTENVVVGVSTDDPLEPYKELRVICKPSE